MTTRYFDTFAEVERYVNGLAKIRRFTNNDKSFIIKIQYTRQKSGSVSWKVEDKSVLTCG